MKKCWQCHGLALLIHDPKIIGFGLLVLHQDHLPLRKMEVQTDGAVSEAVRKVFNIQGKKKSSIMLSLNRLKKEPPWKLCQPQAKQRHLGMGWENGNAGSNCGPRKAPLQHCSLHWHISLELVLENIYWRRGKTRVCLPRAEAGEISQPPQSSTTPHAPGYHECCSLRAIRGPPLQQKFTAKNGQKMLAPLYLPHSHPYVFVEGKDYKGKKNL